MKWTDTRMGSALHDDDGKLLAKVRPLGAGGAAAQWCNGDLWDVTDQLKNVGRQSSRHFKTVAAGKRAVDKALAAAAGKQSPVSAS